ncbi:hypothetical protein DN122_24915 [Salmonella enterica subsp. enterica serovar Coquilhatville]|nr:hypothetical protein [Salmonella enterica subsp. enterica serovar Coquilhatville]
MSIDMIRKIMPVPENPYEIRVNDDWAAVESELRIVLPDDYKMFIDEYGSGSINGFLWVFSPFVDNPYIHLIETGRARISALTELKQKGEKFPYELFPSEEGCLPFGATDNGDTLFWKLEKMGSWKIVINEARSPLCDEFNLGWSEFMYELLLGRLKSEVLPMDVFKRTPYFKPVNL